MTFIASLTALNWFNIAAFVFFLVVFGYIAFCDSTEDDD